MRSQFPGVELVSKDTMMRIKARELGFKAQDYYRYQAENNYSKDFPKSKVKEKKSSPRYL
jgi:predicted ribonuclease YlaK